MLHITGSSVKDVYKKTFFSLLKGKRYDDPEIYKEDSAVIEVFSNRKQNNLKMVNEKFILSHAYDRLFPFVDKELPDEEMKYWTKSLISEGRFKKTVEYLREYPLSKRAIVLFWNEKYQDLNGPSVCEIAAFFRKKGNRLDMHTMMRANNASFLLYMDLEVLTGVHQLFCDSLHLRVGKYIHFVNSLHFYEAELGLIEKQYNLLKHSEIWKTEKITK